jgi:hypothetical protein
MTQAIGYFTKRAEPCGAYQPTSRDAEKAAADFLVIDVSTAKCVIDWRDGRREWVSRRELKKLQAAHTWMTNF